MKKEFFTGLAVLLTASLAYADNPWSSLTGCYVTEQRNGAPVDSDGAGSKFGGIQESDSAEFGIVENLEGQKIPTLGFLIFQKHSVPDNKDFYDYKGAFDKMGSYSSDADGLHYRFDGDLLYVNDPQDTMRFTLHETIDVKRVDAERLFLHTTQTVPQIADGSMDSDDTYVIRKVDCHTQGRQQ